MIIKNALVYQEDHSFRKQDLFIGSDGLICSQKDEAITSDKAGAATEEIDAEGLYAIPGLIDLHLHGCMGVDFSDGNPEAIRTMAEYLGSNGVTGFAPATMTLGHEALLQVFQTAGRYALSENKPSPDQKLSELLGIHMEGPYFSEKKKGAQAATHLRKPDFAEVMEFQEASGGLLRQVDVAPELSGAMEFIEQASRHFVVSLAHTEADYDTASAAFDCGASHVTHLFNAMPPFTHRNPGVIGAAFDHHAKVELICDGFHIHPSALRAAFAMFGKDRIIMISDSMMAAGMPNGTYSLGGQDVFVRDGKATLSDGTIAGSAVTLMECLRRIVSFGVPLETAVQCASENPARELGVFDRLGSLAPGKAGRVALLDHDLNLVRVVIEA